jgi:hypothetical protein
VKASRRKASRQTRADVRAERPRLAARRPGCVSPALLLPLPRPLRPSLASHLVNSSSCSLATDDLERRINSQAQLLLPSIPAAAGGPDILPARSPCHCRPPRRPRPPAPSHGTGPEPSPALQGQSRPTRQPLDCRKPSLQRTLFSLAYPLTPARIHTPASGLPLCLPLQQPRFRHPSSTRA